MTKRLQILVSEAELEQLRISARADNVSMGEWIRKAMHRSFSEPEARTVEAKLLAIREAMKFNAPTADIDQMNREIEQGYLSGLP